MPESWFRTPLMFRGPQAGVVNQEHRDMDYLGRTCWCPHTTGDYVQANIYTSHCFQVQHYQQKDHVKEFNRREEHFFPNPSRVYMYSTRSSLAVVQVPSPFLLAWRWSPRPYLAANAMEPAENFMSRLFYTLATVQSYRDTCTPYLTEPNKWDSSNHPLWQEPSRADELQLWTKDLYGVESLGRILFAQHPARSSELYMYSCMSYEFAVPVLTECETPDAVEIYLKAKLEPFYKHGYGKVICLICIFRVAEGKVIPKAYSRSSYSRHFAKDHHRNIGVMGLGFGTQYNCRMLQAQIIYHFILACMSEGDVDSIH